MDPTSTVRTDAVPVVATVIAPGLVVSSPYLWAILSTTPQLRAFLDRHEAVTVAAATLTWIVAGFAVESVGSYVEVYGIDRRRTDHAQMLDTWWRYLRIAWNKEPIGQRYLRRLLVMFKFELNICVAALATTPGVLVLGCMHQISGRATAAGIVVLLLISVVAFLAARGTAQVLADVRAALVQGVGEPPFDATGNPSRPA